MKSFYPAIDIICRYEGFSEKAYPDHKTGNAPYTIGFGTQFYPDGSPVLRGQCCTKEKGLQYLLHELDIIDEDLDKINLVLDESMRQSLLSFIHSIGWHCFLHSSLIDHIGNEDWKSVVHEMQRWLLDEDHQVIGGLMARRREEISLFLSELNETPHSSTNILLTAVLNYSGKSNEINAIQKLEANINPYAVAEFWNEFYKDSNPYGCDNEFLGMLDEF